MDDGRQALPAEKGASFEKPEDMFKRLLPIALAVLAVAQFIQPDRSAPPVVPSQDMLTMTNAPADIQGLVTGACYDCHSYTTDYPWYGYITPMNFIVQDHINEGRDHLNFSLWDKYAGSEEAGEAGEELQEGEMPPGYYRLMHGHGRLADADKKRLVAWFKANMTGGEGGESERGAGKEEHEEHGSREHQ